MSAPEAIDASSQARSRWYWLLGRVLGEPPQRALLEEMASLLADTDTHGELGGAALALKNALADCIANPAALADAEVEYARWLGSARRAGGPEPFESMVREGRLFGAATESVSGLYAEAGFPDLVHMDWPADHVSTELRFMALLAYREATARSAKNAAEVRAVIQREIHFLRTHLLSWLPHFCDELAAASPSPLYRAVVRLLAAASRGDLEDLEQLEGIAPGTS